jgi:transcriptional regulator with XRE-family HTH domain
MPDLIRRLDTYRLGKKLSQEEIAKKLGVAFSTVNRWFNDKAKPNKIQTFHIEKLLNLKG